MDSTFSFFNGNTCSMQSDEITLKGDIHTILARLCILVGMFLEVIHTCSFIFQFLVCTFILGEHTAFD